LRSGTCACTANGCGGAGAGTCQPHQVREHT
jgi:hypothetical protein